MYYKQSGLYKLCNLQEFSRMDPKFFYTFPEINNKIIFMISMKRITFSKAFTYMQNVLLISALLNFERLRVSY